MKHLALALVVFAAACTTPVTPPAPATWQDAWTVYLQAWCDNTKRCAWDYYAEHFPNGECVGVELEHFCVETSTACTTPYPQSHDAALDQCALEVENLYCGALLPPDSCFEALTP